jgi:hypothetical protein
MPNALATTPPTPIDASSPLSGRELRQRLAIIQEVMKSVMVQDVDYGTIPGTPKPTLFKPGAEKLCVTFKLSALDPQIIDVPDVVDDEIRYRVRVPIAAATGVIIAVGVGECSTCEEKYKWRRPVHQKEYDNAPIDRKREKYQRNGDVWQQVRVEPSDVANTVLKMAHKRAYVHAVIMATAAGSIFTQDLEDRPEGMDDAEPARPAQPQTRQQAAQAPAPAATGGGPVISEPQDKRLFAIRNGTSITDTDLKAWLMRRYPYTVDANGVVSTSRIRRADYDAIVDCVKAGDLS